MLYISEIDRDRTAVLIDAGYLNTEVIAVEGDAIIFHKVLPLGGGHIAADLAYGLEIPLDQAEQVKRGYEFGLGSTKNSFDVAAKRHHPDLHPGKGGQHPEPRVDEICEAIVKALKDSGVRLATGPRSI